MYFIELFRSFIDDEAEKPLRSRIRRKSNHKVGAHFDIPKMVPNVPAAVSTPKKSSNILETSSCGEMSTQETSLNNSQDDVPLDVIAGRESPTVSQNTEKGQEIDLTGPDIPSNAEVLKNIKSEKPRVLQTFRSNMASAYERFTIQSAPINHELNVPGMNQRDVVLECLK